MEAQARKSYPMDVTDEEWAFVAPYLACVQTDRPASEPPMDVEVVPVTRALGGTWRRLGQRRPSPTFFGLVCVLAMPCWVMALPHRPAHREETLS